jgi:regulator of protease activity HflC (stomatin/prohibitin superfamily)
MNLVKRLLMNTAAGISALIIANSTLYTVDQTEQAVITSFGDPVKVVLNPIETDKTKRNEQMERIKFEIKNYTDKENVPIPGIDESGAGLKVKLPWHSVYKFDHRLLEWDGAPEQIPTRDKKYSSKHLAAKKSGLMES